MDVRISDIGGAEAQAISPEVIGSAVKELEQEIVSLHQRIADLVDEVWTLQSRNTELSRHNSEKDERVRELVKCDWDAQAEITRLEKRLGNQARTIKVQAATIARVVEGSDINRFISPVEPPLPTNTVNVSGSYKTPQGEPVAVHPAPNVTIAGGE
jgi:regulator of replication initiation timing